MQESARKRPLAWAAALISTVLLAGLLYAGYLFSEGLHVARQTKALEIKLRYSPTVAGIFRHPRFVSLIRPDSAAQSAAIETADLIRRGDVEPALKRLPAAAESEPEITRKLTTLLTELKEEEDKRNSVEANWDDLSARAEEKIKRYYTIRSESCKALGIEAPAGPGDAAEPPKALPLFEEGPLNGLPLVEGLNADAAQAQTAEPVLAPLREEARALVSDYAALYREISQVEEELDAHDAQVSRDSAEAVAIARDLVFHLSAPKADPLAASLYLKVSKLLANYGMALPSLYREAPGEADEQPVRRPADTDSQSMRPRLKSESGSGRALFLPDIS